jgi:Protein of unknown function (DUF1376)
MRGFLDDFRQCHCASGVPEMTRKRRPDPLVPAHVDLRDLDGFMLNTERLMTSEFFALSTGDEFKAGVALWCKAWKQMPCGSLPNDDKILASFSGANGNWPNVKTMALRGWIECSDGRLYHRVLSLDVPKAYQKRMDYKKLRDGNAERKERERAERKQMFQTLKDQGITPAWNITTSELRALVTRDGQTPVTPPVTVTVTANTGTGTGTKKKEQEDKNKIDSSEFETTSAPHPEKPAEPVTPKAARKTGTRWPANQPVPREWLLIGYEARVRAKLPPINFDLAAVEFTNHWTGATGRAATSLDWLATWRNWCTSKYRQPLKPNGNGAHHANGKSQQPESPHSRFLRAAASVIAETENRAALARTAEGDPDHNDALSPGRPLLPSGHA